MTLLAAVKAADQDFEWYPTTQRMIDVVAKHIPADTKSIMDIGAGDGRVLVELAKRCEYPPELYAIEKSSVLVEAQPEEVTPVGTDLHEQNLACLPVDYIFSNPPYSESEYVSWARVIIEFGYAKKAFLVLPRRWKDDQLIQAALQKRGAEARVIHSDDFYDGPRPARAVVDIVEIRYPTQSTGWSGTEKAKDPFDIWFDQNIDTFDQAEEVEDPDVGSSVERLKQLWTIGEMVAAYNDEYARMSENYRAIFRLDYAILKELGVNKEHVRDGIKKKMAGLKSKYWHLLFDRLDTITNRFSTATRKKFLDRLAGRAAIEFTSSNAYAVVLWAIKHANKYYDEQLVQLFRDLSTFEGVLNYKSNQRVWQRDDWRFYHDKPKPSHYALDYRFVVRQWQAIGNGGSYQWQYPGNLYEGCHNLIADVIVVLYNLGYATVDSPSKNRQWEAGQWQDFTLASGDVLFQVKAHKNGNLHFRFMPAAIKAINVEAGRLLGWIRSKQDVVKELGYTEAEADRFYRSSVQIGVSSVRMLTAGDN